MLKRRGLEPEGEHVGFTAPRDCHPLLGLLAAPLAAEGQPAGKGYRVGYMSLAPGLSPRSEAFRQGLRDLGYVEGQNITIEYRWAQGKPTRLRDLAAELVRLKVDVIVTGGPTATRAAKEATNTIPIVMGFDADPVEAEFVTSLARPGGNITGTALALRVQLQFLEVQGLDDFEGAFRAARRERADALIMLPDYFMLFFQKRLVELAAKDRLPAIHWDRGLAEAGGLMAYGASDRDLHRRADAYVDKILKGAKPGDLPVEQPTKFELIINRKTAKALGLTIPQSLLLRADEIIE
jgi:putative ABC transport system substrate-binding protein